MRSSRMPALGPMIAAAILLLAGCNDSPTSEPGDRVGFGGARAAKPTLNPAELPAAPPAGSPCLAPTGTVDFVHPTFGPVRLFVHGQGGDKGATGCLVLVDRNSVVRYSYTGEDGYRLAPAVPPTDVTGNVFLVYNPGRYDGVIVLVPTADGFAPFTRDYRSGQHRYYYAELLPPGSDGRVSIKAFRNDCEPSCAGGTITANVLTWNGSDYS